MNWSHEIALWKSANFIAARGDAIADIVAKVAEQMLWNSNLKQSNRGECDFRQIARAPDSRVLPFARRRGDRVNRREFITLLGGTATRCFAWR